MSCVPRAEAQKYKSTCSFAGLKGPLPRTEVRGFHREAHPRPDLKKTPQSAQPRECASTAAKTHRKRRCGSKFVAQQDPNPPQNLPVPGKRPGSGARDRRCLSLTRRFSCQRTAPTSRRSLGTQFLPPQCDLQEAEIQDSAVEVLSEIFH